MQTEELDVSLTLGREHGCQVYSSTFLYQRFPPSTEGQGGKHKEMKFKLSSELFSEKEKSLSTEYYL